MTIESALNVSPNEREQKYPLHGDARNRRWIYERLGTLSDLHRNYVLNRLEATALYWFVQAGGNPDEFENLYNAKK